MAHECPNCGLTCFCDGDLDDMLFNLPGNFHHCHHCYDDDDEDDFEYDDWLDYDDITQNQKEK